ncbi:putative transcription fungi [Rosellinia necatrix]|uniref:Putative transcription fungi n=1 Tax=Rosellinia necatrix TaxID=77044 RepID=A0A1W2TP98_ROSNE|nr:putative transcription fungi [Rosellinia necatrix]
MAEKVASSPADDGIRYDGSGASPSEAEKHAKTSSSSSAVAALGLPTPSLPTSTVAPAQPKPRSCVVCRSRKVRCDKKSPCSNCRRAGTPCVVPSADRPPRWARRLERLAHGAAADEGPAHVADSPTTAQVMERLRNLEGVVKDLSKQLEQAHAQAANPSAGHSPASSSSHDRDRDRDRDHQQPAQPATGTGNIQAHFGRLVLNDASRSRYVSSGFWSRVNDELDEIRIETQHLAEGDLDSSEDEEQSGTSPPTRELERTASERHAFLFRHNLNTSHPNLRELQPLPSQIPFLLDVFSERVNDIVKIVHMPTVNKLARRSMGSDITPPTPANEALLFSIYYAAVTSMEEDDVLINFGSTKTDLNLKYRLGLEHALARADFLNVPDLVLVQAFAIFLLLVRRHDSPRFVWMMTGLVIRMAQALGLQRDGTCFKHLTPFEVEIRRRVWYALCSLDVRASEDQGTDFTIQHGSFDTKLPLNINDSDISVNMEEPPIERHGITDMTLPIVSMEISIISRQMLFPGVSLEKQNHLIGTIYATLEERYLRFSTEPGDIACWVMIVIARLVSGKLTLFTHLPILFSTPGEHFSDAVRNKLLVAAIEVAELNHALNTNKACRQWRWVYQTYTHWHAIIYILLDICRRPWSPIIERAWIALHSPWLIPTISKLDKGLRTWVPFRKLTWKARKHREAELERLRGDPSAARQLEMNDRGIPVPSTVGHESSSAIADVFQERWRRLVGISEQSGGHTQKGEQPSPSFELLKSARSFPDSGHNSWNNVPETVTGPPVPHTSVTGMNRHEGSIPLSSYDVMALDQPLRTESQFNAVAETSSSWSGSHPGNDGLLGWFWEGSNPTIDTFTDVDIDTMDFNVNMDEAVDWHNWVESAKSMEADAHVGTSNPERRVN